MSYITKVPLAWNGAQKSPWPGNITWCQQTYHATSHMRLQYMLSCAVPPQCNNQLTSFLYLLGCMAHLYFSVCTFYLWTRDSVIKQPQVCPSDGSQKPLALGANSLMCASEGKMVTMRVQIYCRTSQPGVCLSLSLFRLCSGRYSKIGVRARGLLTRNIHLRIRESSWQSKHGHLGRLLEEAMRWLTVKCVWYK